MTWGSMVEMPKRKDGTADRLILKSAKILFALDEEIRSLTVMVDAAFKRHHIVNPRQEIHIVSGSR